jgi:CW_7 repeat
MSGPGDMSAPDSEPRLVESDDPETVEDTVDEDNDESESKQSLTEVAEAVGRGEYGTGQERRLKLAEAGYDPKEVEAEIVRLRNS